MEVLALIIVSSYFICTKKDALSFDKDNSALLKAILPFIIIFAHTKIYGHGTYAVAFFFFISGYGLESKRMCNRQKIKEFRNWGGRIINLLKAFIVPLALYLATKSIFRGLSWNDITSSLLSYQLIVPHSWFILTLIQLYLMYWLACSFSEKYFLLVITTIVGLYTAIIFSFHVESSYYSPVPGFIAGILFYHLLPFFEKYHRIAISMSFMVLIIALAIYELTPPLEMFYNLWLFIYPSAILLSAVITKNKVVEFFSNISYEIYLSQGAAFIIAYTVCDNPWMVFLVTSVLSVLLAWLSKRLTQVFF